MIDILDEASLSDPLLIGIANTVLIEIAKRVPQIPLDPANPNQVRFVSGCLILVLAIIKMVASHTFNMADLQGSLRLLGQMWLMGWVVSHVAYKATPFLEKPKTSEVEVVPVVNDEGDAANRAFVKE